jgi:hypothetical protein
VLQRSHEGAGGVREPNEGAVESPGGALVTYCLYDPGGKLISCRLCGHADRWTMESEGVVFVCEHEPVSLVRGAVRQLSSTPAAAVAAYEFVGMKQPGPGAPDVPPWAGAVGA